jgi:hypothetical protein
MKQLTNRKNLETFWKSRMAHELNVMRQINMKDLHNFSPDSLLQEYEAFRPFFTLPLVSWSPSFLFLYTQNILLNVQLQPRRRGQHVNAKRCYPLTILHSITIQKMTILIACYVWIVSTRRSGTPSIKYDLMISTPGMLAFADSVRSTPVTLMAC